MKPIRHVHSLGTRIECAERDVLVAYVAPAQPYGVLWWIASGLPKPAYEAAVEAINRTQRPDGIPDGDVVAQEMNRWLQRAP